MRRKLPPPREAAEPRSLASGRALFVGGEVSNRRASFRHLPPPHPTGENTRGERARKKRRRNERIKPSGWAEERRVGGHGGAGWGGKDEPRSVETGSLAGAPSPPPSHPLIRREKAAVFSFFSLSPDLHSWIRKQNTNFCTRNLGLAGRRGGWRAGEGEGVLRYVNFSTLLFPGCAFASIVALACAPLPRVSASVCWGLSASGGWAGAGRTRKVFVEFV